jgi:16S rRNA (guanine966-N2)-methyltransferase
MPARSKKNHRTQKTNEYPEKRAAGKHLRNENTKSGSFRIIGGTWRSRRLSFPAVEGLRPTTDRVKETVFNWLAPYIEGAKVLDVFAGSGSLGIEALSRGAGSLTAIERDRTAAESIKANLQLLGVQNSQGMVKLKDALRWLNEGQDTDSTDELVKEYDIVLLDPPFRQGLLNQCIEILEKQSIVKTGAIIYLEREKEATDTVIPFCWRLLKEKTAGQVCYQLFMKSAS